MPGRVVASDVSSSTGGGATGTVLAGGVGAGGLPTDAAAGGGVGVATGVVGGVVTGGGLGFGDGSLGLGRFPGGGPARLGSTRGVCTGSVRGAEE